MSHVRHAPLWKRLIAFFVDHLVILFLGVTIPWIIVAARGDLASSIGEPVAASSRLGFAIYVVGQFLYQYWALLSGRPTIGQSVARFYVDAKAASFIPGRLQYWLQMTGIDLVAPKSPFWPATVHMVLATISMLIWPLAVLEALWNPERRFWWARVSGTFAVDMEAAFRKPRKS